MGKLGDYKGKNFRGRKEQKGNIAWNKSWEQGCLAVPGQQELCVWSVQLGAGL